jgi:predicted transposase/invertase (TIGR01784 family)
MTILDIKAVDEKGTWYDIEMQLAEQGYYDKRAFYYWAKVYSDQIESGDDFDLLRKTIAINILDFNYLNEENFHNVYKVYNESSRKEFSDIFQMHFIELNKFKKDFGDLNTALDRWTAFLSRAYEIDRDKIPEELAGDSSVKKAIEKLDIMYLDKEEREIYENDLKRLRIQKAEIKAAGARGREEGRREGENKKAIEIAKSLLDVLDIEIIASKTKLSVDIIKKLKD